MSARDHWEGAPAAFHFLTDDADRDAYLAAMERALQAGGHALLSVFVPEAPEQMYSYALFQHASE